jgi:hypothetical protein
VSRSPTPEVLAVCWLCRSIPELTVRRQVALTLGFFRDDGYRKPWIDSLRADGAREEVRIAILSSVSSDSPLFARLNSPKADNLATPLNLPKPSNARSGKGGGQLFPCGRASPVSASHGREAFSSSSASFATS